MALTGDDQTTLSQLKNAMAAFVDERDWMQFHSPKNLAMAIAAEAAELMEPLMWVDGEASHALVHDPKRRHAISDELADIVLAAVQFANVSGIDIATAVRDKLVKNERKYPVDKAHGNATKYTEL